MNIDEEYPQALYGEFPSCIRLLTAVHLACVDAGGDVFNLEFSDDELQDFFNTNTHNYFSVKPRGNLKKAAELLSKAICKSIQGGELKLVVTRKNLEGEISLLNSWVSSDEFSDWCDSRAIRLDEGWFDFWKVENNIAASAIEESDARRRQYEGLLESKDFDEESLRKKLEEEGFESLLNEVAILRSKLKARETTNVASENPLSGRERNTLLTIIAALAKAAKINFNEAGKAALSIEGLTAELGARVSKRAIEEHLKKIPDALETRMK